MTESRHESPADGNGIPDVQPPDSRYWKMLAFLFGMLFIGAGALSAYLWQFRYADRPIVIRPQSSTNSPTPSAQPDVWKTYAGKGFALQYPSGWENLMGECQQIKITVSDAIERELPLTEYAAKKLFGGNMKLLENAVTNAKKEFPVPFPYLDPAAVAVVGPTGEGEINNIFIKGPPGTGYVHIAVWAVQSGGLHSQTCRKLDQGQYKEILSTFTFTSRPATGTLQEITELHIAFTLPTSVANKNWNIERISGETGDNICFHIPDKTTGLVKKVYAGGAGVCYGEFLTVNATSSDFSVGRGGTFSDISGYVTKNGNIYLSDVPDTDPMDSDVVSERTNQYGVKYARFLGKLYAGPVGLPGPGSVGAIINTKDPKYPGIVVYMTLSDTLTLADFDTFMNTFRFTQ